MAIARRIIGVILLIATVFYGLYETVWVWFIGGIAEIIDGVKHTPVNKGELLSGFGWLFGSVIPAILTAIAAFIVIAIFIGAEFLPKPLRRNRAGTNLRK